MRSVHSESNVLFPQHGLVDTLDRVGHSSARPCRLQSIRQVYGLRKASDRWIDAEGKYHALTTAEVLRWLNLVPTHFELQIRLRWRQSILMGWEGNEALLGIFFGRLGAGSCRTIAGQWHSFPECSSLGTAVEG